MHGRLVVLLACLFVGGFTVDAYGQTKSGSAKSAVSKKKAKKKKKAAQAKAPATVVAPSPAPIPAPPAATPAPAAPDGFRELKATSDVVTPAPLPAPAAVPAIAPLAPPPSPSPVIEAKAEESEPLGLEIALKLAMLVPSGNTAEAMAAAESAAEAGKSVFASGALALRYRPPFLERALSVNLEGGYYRLSGAGKRSFVNDPDYGPELSYSWKMDAIPVLFGLGYQLPLPLPVAIIPGAGFAAVHVSSESTYSSAGGDVTNAPQSGWALGFYLGVEGALQLGPGSLLVEVRYMNARTDLGFQELYAGPYNAEPGDVQGTNLLLGYRYAF